MTFDKVHFRHCLLHEFQQGHAADAWRNLVNVFGQEMPSRQTCSHWFSRFRSGNFLDGKEFETDEEVKSAIFTFFASKPQSSQHYIVDSAGEYCSDKFVK